MKKRLLISICATSMIPLQGIGAPPVEEPTGSPGAAPPPAGPATPIYGAGTNGPETWDPSLGAYGERGRYEGLPSPPYDRGPQSAYGGYRYGYGYSRRSGAPPRGYQYGYSYGPEAPLQGYEYTYGPETPYQDYGQTYGPPMHSYGYGPPAGYGAPPGDGGGWGGYPPYGPDTGYGEMPYAPDARDFSTGAPRGAPPGYGAPQPYRDEWQGAPGYVPGAPDEGGAFGGYPGGGYAPTPYPRGPAMPGGERGAAPGVIEDRPAGPTYAYPGGWGRQDRFRGYPPPRGYYDEYVPPPPPEPIEMAPATPGGVMPPASEGAQGLPGDEARGVGGETAATPPSPSVSAAPADAGPAGSAPEDESIKVQ